MNEWQEHVSGDPCPVEKGTLIDVVDADGCTWDGVKALEHYAVDKIFWGLDVIFPQDRIVKWRLAE